MDANEEKLKIAVKALEEVSDWKFGWDGDCGVTRCADDALAAIEAIAPPVAAGSVDTPEFVWPDTNYQLSCDDYEVVNAAISAWGAQQREHGAKEVTETAMQVLVQGQEWQRRAEKAEAELESWVHTNRIDELQRNYSAALARIMYLEAELRIAQSC